MPAEPWHPASPCLNCGTVPAGPWCQGCGQKAGPAHRSLLHLGMELAEILTHADSRFWLTLRRLVLHPGRLTLDYLDGKRVSEIPPLRLFFVSLLLLFAVGSLGQTTLSIGVISPHDQVSLQAEIATLSVGEPHLNRWLHGHLSDAARHPDQVLAVMRDWLERFIVLLLPFGGIMLWLLYALPPRGFTLYDHLVVTIHSLSFAGLPLVVLFAIEPLLPRLSALLLLAYPVHLFLHLRGVYRASVAGTLVRMALLIPGGLMAISVLLLGLAAVGLQFGVPE